MRFTTGNRVQDGFTAVQDTLEYSHPATYDKQTDAQIPVLKANVGNRTNICNNESHPGSSVTRS